MLNKSVAIACLSYCQITLVVAMQPEGKLVCLTAIDCIVGGLAHEKSTKKTDQQY